MRYSVDDEIFESVEEAVDYCISDRWHEDDDYFVEWVNDREECVNICGTTYYAYDILRQFESDDLNDLLDDFCNAMNESDRDEALWELRHANPGDSVDCQGYTIFVISDEEAEEDEEETEDKIEKTRRFIEEQRILVETYENDCKKTENDMLELFQVIT